MLRVLAWVGSSKKAYAQFPQAVQDDFGYRLYRVQVGETIFPAAKPLNKGLLSGLGIMELCGDHHGDTFRAVYTARFEGVVYVLHAFKKKSRSGIATSVHDVRLIHSRYREAVEMHESMRASLPVNSQPA